VFALVGDGTYLMLPAEIVTAVQEGLAINVVIVQNHGYASIGGPSRQVGGEGFGTAYRFRGEDGAFTGEPLPVDLAANAASLGVEVFTARTAAELRPGLAAARKSPRASAVYVETDASREGVGAQAWWDVRMAETSALASTRAARAAYGRARP
jgi:3D-(3,5/4)-trihydroxycyclohexane-1,2-dione acylhydrolase (decyclizing)